MRAAFTRLQSLVSERNRLATDAREKTRREEYLRFQLTEIERVAPQPGEDDELVTARQVLGNAERLQRLCADTYTALYEGEEAALPTLSAVWKKLGELASIDPQFAPHLAAKDAVKSQLEDLAYFLRSYASAIDASPGKLQDVEDRLAVLERLKKKHGPALARRDRNRGGAPAGTGSPRWGGRAGRGDRGGADGRPPGLSLSSRRTLSKARRSAAVEFARRLETSLGDLAMTQTRCEVRFVERGGEDGWSERGIDEGEFYISPNPGEDLRPLARIASGGELSRIMLALKTLASTDAPGKTLIFDEVDAGIGGSVADIVGARLRQLGSRVQVLCITHLPQIAAYGTSHYRIAKTLKDGRTVTGVAPLGVRDREDELARMIAGADVSASVRASAREMLKRRVQ